MLCLTDLPRPDKCKVKSRADPKYLRLKRGGPVYERTGEGSCNAENGKGWGEEHLFKRCFEIGSGGRYELRGWFYLASSETGG